LREQCAIGRFAAQFCSYPVQLSKDLAESPREVTVDRGQRRARLGPLARNLPQKTVEEDVVARLVHDLRRQKQALFV
jgi:hypothetical protein